MEAKSEVLNWINSNFNIAKVKIKDFPRLPAGKLVIDNNKNVTIVFYDFLNNRVLISYPNDSGFKTAV